MLTAFFRTLLVVWLQLKNTTNFRCMMEKQLDGSDTI